MGAKQATWAAFFHHDPWEGHRSRCRLSYPSASSSSSTFSAISSTSVAHGSSLDISSCAQFTSLRSTEILSPRSGLVTAWMASSSSSLVSLPRPVTEPRSSSASPRATAGLLKALVSLVWGEASSRGVVSPATESTPGVPPPPLLICWLLVNSISLGAASWTLRDSRASGRQSLR